MQEPTLDEIITARNECAKIIATHGEQFLPIFERLEEEIELRKKRVESLNRAIQIGTQNGTHFGTHLKTPNFIDTKLSNEFNCL